MLQRCDSISPNYVLSDLRDLTWLTTTHNLDCISVFLRVKEQQVFAHSLPKHFLCCTAVAKITSSVYTLSYMLVNWSYLWAGVLQSDHNCFWHYVISRMTFWSFGLISERNSSMTLAWFCSEMSSHQLTLSLCCELLCLVVNLVNLVLFLIEGGRLREP